MTGGTGSAGARIVPVWTVGQPFATPLSDDYHGTATELASEVRPGPDVEVLSKRTLMSAAVNPVVGSGFVSGGELFDAQGARVGDGFSHCGVVAVSVAVPPAVTTHCTSVFRLGDGELHLSGRRHYRSIAAGFDDTAVAVTGGRVRERAR